MEMSIVTTSYEKVMHYEIVQILGRERDYITKSILFQLNVQNGRSLNVTFRQYQLELYTGKRDTCQRIIGLANRWYGPHTTYHSNSFKLQL